MPTKPLEPVLNRELSVVAAQDILNIASPLLKELVNYSTNALQRCRDSSSGIENQDGAIFTLYLHIMEMTDGVEVLISQSCGAPAIPLVRSAFEAMLGIEYLLEKEYVQRSLSWLAMYARNRLKTYDLFDPSTPKGQEFQKACSTDKVAQNLPLPPLTEVQKAKSNLNKLFTKPQFQPILAEINKQKGNNLQWYSLFGGPKNLKELARYLHREVQYFILYQQWSSVGHAQDLSRFLQRSLSADPTRRELRDSTEVREIVHYSALFILEATRLLLVKFRPGEDIRTWYLRDIRESLKLVGILDL